MDQEALERVAQRYRDEGYDVVVHPGGDLVPTFLSGFQPDLIATRGKESAVVEIKTNRVDLSNDPYITRLAEIIEAQPGWRLDLVVLESESTVDRAAQDATEPTEDQIFQTLRSAEELADKGYAPSACVMAWAGLEAAMRRIRDDAELYGRTTPIELMRALYSNGFLSREQFDRLRDSFKIRSQIVHGLVPPRIEPDMVRFIAATARSLVRGEEAAVSPN